MQKNKHQSKQRGSVMLIMTLFFTLLGTATIFSTSNLAVHSLRDMQNTTRTRQSYSAAESGLEDVIYRLKNNMQVNNSESISINGATATTVITNINSAQKQIDSVGINHDLERRIRSIMETSSGIVFRYGSQAGQGGVIFANNAGLYGSLYSNGSVQGSNGAFVTGDLYVANSPALSADQSNDTPTTPSYDMVFGNATSTQDFAQSFQLSTSGLLNKAQVYIKKVGSPGNATIRIVTDSSGNPGTSNITTGTLNANLITSNYGWVDVFFNSNPTVTSATTYWMVIDGSSSSNDYYVIGGSNSYTGGVGKIGRQGSSWGNTSPSGLDGYFKIYMGGINSYIDNMTVGTSGVGDIYANTVTNSTAAGSIYCQTGSGNNKSCINGGSDPTPESLPVSDSNIAEWKDHAVLGGTINGTQTISSPTSLGPTKIVGDLNIANDLTITGTIWVTGDINISGSGTTVSLDSSYADTSAVVIADGQILIDNNVDFVDSGTSGSYIMLLSTSTCDSSVVGNPCGTGDAINIRNNSSIVIANAQKGSIHFKNNSGVKEVVANKIILDNNVTVTYGTGLININFSSGPSGSWDIASWKESD